MKRLVAASVLVLFLCAVGWAIGVDDVEADRLPYIEEWSQGG